MNSDENGLRFLLELTEIEHSTSEKVSLRLMRDALKFLINTHSPCLIIGHDTPVFYVPKEKGRTELIPYVHNISASAIYFASLKSRKLNCPRCIVELYSSWKSETNRSLRITDYVGDTEKLQKTRKAFSTAHNRWRRKLLKSSGGRCSVCGDKNDPELAHITPVEDFFYLYRKGRRLRYPTARYLGVEHSYREDNLTILCRRCHDAQTMSWGPVYAIADPDNYMELLHRKHEVTDLFESVIRKRNWSSADDLQQRRLF